MPTTIYHFDAVTNEYIGSDIADLDPIENKPIIPAYATLITIPSSIPTGSMAMFDIKTDTWTIVEDHRGKIYDTTTGAESMFDKLGALPAGKVDVAPPDAMSKWDSTLSNWVADLGKHQSSATTTINVAYQTSLHVNIKVPSLKAAFQADAQSRTKIDACINRLNNGWVPPVGAGMWYDATNGTHPINLTTMNTIANDIATRDANLFVRLQKAKAAIRSATTVSQVQAVIL